MEAEESTINFLAGYIARKYLNVMAPGRRIRIDALDESLSIALATRLLAWVEENQNIQATEDLVVAVVSSKTTHSVFMETEIAIGHRNRNKRMLLFIPGTAAVAAQSLGVNTFENLSLESVIINLQKEIREDLLSRAELSIEIRSILQHQRTSPSIKSLEFLIAAHENGLYPQIGRDFWKLGLIPDLGESPWLRVASNSKMTQMLIGTGRSVLTASERVAQIRLGSPQLRSRLEELLVRQVGPLSGILERMSGTGFEALTFEKWIFIDEPAEEIDSLEVIPFLDEQGKVDARCKLRLDPVSEVLYAKSKVSVYWSTNPSNIKNLGSWLIELVPPSSLAEDAQALRELAVKPEKRMITLDLDLEDDEAEMLYPRYIIRVSALDKSGKYLSARDGNLAQAETQEFAIESDGEVVGNVERVTNATSLSEAYILRVLEGKDSDKEQSPTWDVENQVFTISSGAFSKTNLRISRSVINLQRRLMANSNLALAFTARTSAGQQIESFEETQLTLPPNLLSKRKKFLDALRKASPFRDTIEVAPWSEDLSAALETYVGAFRSSCSSLAGEELGALMQMDTVNLAVQTPRGVVQGILLLPTHPLRALWVMQHDRLLRDWAETLKSHSKKTRKSQVEEKLVSKVTASNLPLFVCSRDIESPANFKGFVYAEEFTHGSAFYVPVSVHESRSHVNTLSQALGLSVQTKSTHLASNLLAERIANYKISRTSSIGLRLNVVNPADGLVIADAIRKVPSYLGENEQLGRLEIKTFSSSLPLVHPVPALELLQSDVEANNKTATQNFIAPSCSIQAQRISELGIETEAVNLSIVQGLSNVEVHSASTLVEKSSYLEGLLTSTTTDFAEIDGIKKCFTYPSLGTANSSKISQLTVAHKAYDQAVSKVLGLPNGQMVLGLNVGQDSIQILENLHKNSDWVCTLDRHLGLSLYENILSNEIMETKILDYAPDFIDGIGERLTITTTDRDEINDVLLDAMDKLGLTGRKGTPEELLRALSSVSGRLALRLFRKDNVAMEAIGLAATVLHLKKNEKLENTILFPVDAHPDLFGVHARDRQEDGQRCDLISIGFVGKKYYLDFIEVKARTNGVETGLESKISSQIKQTAKILGQRLGFGEVKRIDSDLQWSRWTGLLHFYADRSAMQGYISSSELAGIHSAIDIIHKGRIAPEIRQSGYIFSLASSNDKIKKTVDGVSIELLNAETAEALGFETKLGLEWQQ